MMRAAVSVFCFVLLLPQPALRAQAVRPLGEILLNLGHASEARARKIAEKQAVQHWKMDKGPLYKSCPAMINTKGNVVSDEKIFEGDFTPNSNKTKLAIFSDDGCDVWVDGDRILHNFKKPQHLPNLAHSFHVLDKYKPKAGKPNHIRIRYSNTIYLGKTDIDGCTLFGYDGGGEGGGAGPELEILDANNKDAVIKEKQVTVVGKKISLKGRINPAPGKKDKVEILWVIPPMTVKGYAPSDEKAEVVELSDEDKKKDAIAFYWIDGADSRVVEFHVTINGQTSKTTADFEVQRPKAEFTSVTTTDAPDTNGVQIGKLAGFGNIIFLHFGSKKSFGIDWTAEVTAPAASGGKIAFTQIVNTLRKRTDNAGTTKTRTFEGSFVLDSTFPYGGGKAVEAKKTATTLASDTPGTSLDDALKFASVDEKYQTYLMFKPDGKDSTWVTLRKTDWFWKGSGDRTGKGTWVFAKDPPPSAAKDPKSENSTTLPVWNKNVKDLEFK